MENKNTEKPEEKLKKELEYAKNRLIDSIKAFNVYLRHSVQKKYYAIYNEYKDAKVFWFDFKKGESLELQTLNGEVCLIDDTGISYYWIEYDYENGKPKKKFTFFCKDIDTGTCNVHVIPGVFERFERSDNSGKTAFVCIDKDGDNTPIKLKKVPSSGFISFSERCFENENEWWVPIGEGDIIRNQIDNKQTIPNFAEVSADFANCEITIRNLLRNYCENIKWKTKGGSGNGHPPKYTIVKWQYFDKDESYKFCADFYKIGYFEKCGLLTCYNCVNLGSSKVNTPVPNEQTIETVYKAFPENSENFISDSDSMFYLTEIDADKFKAEIKKYLSKQSENNL